jgi:mutator protein MutT
MSKKAKTTLLFLRQDDQILLAMKKRGFGVNKWNGAGGKVEAGETVEQAAVRECQEEIGVTPTNLKYCGRIFFNDLPDVKHYCYLYQTWEWIGEPHETEEMRPQWFHISDVPYDQMWPDDRFWIPKMLDGITLKGRVVIENDVMLECTIEEDTAPVYD